MVDILLGTNFPHGLPANSRSRRYSLAGWTLATTVALNRWARTSTCHYYT